MTIDDDDTVPSPPFNPDNVAALARHLPSESFAETLVLVAGSGTTEEEARQRVAAALDERVREVRAQLDGETAVA